MSLDYSLFCFKAHYFSRADVALPGFAKWFEKASKEERDHATGLIEYVNKRGGEVKMSDLTVSLMFDFVYITIVFICSFHRLS